jgi:hypothetical protein
MLYRSYIEDFLDFRLSYRVVYWTPSSFVYCRVIILFLATLHHFLCRSYWDDVKLYCLRVAGEVLLQEALRFTYAHVNKVSIISICAVEFWPRESDRQGTKGSHTFEFLTTETGATFILYITDLSLLHVHIIHRLAELLIVGYFAVNY